MTIIVYEAGVLMTDSKKVSSTGSDWKHGSLGVKIRRICDNAYAYATCGDDPEPKDQTAVELYVQSSIFLGYWTNKYVAADIATRKVLLKAMKYWQKQMNAAATLPTVPLDGIAMGSGVAVRLILPAPRLREEAEYGGNKYHVVHYDITQARNCLAMSELAYNVYRQEGLTQKESVERIVKDSSLCDFPLQSALLSELRDPEFDEFIDYLAALASKEETK